MDVLVVCAELSPINLIALNSTIGAIKLAVEYKVSIKGSAKMIIQIFLDSHDLFSTAFTANFVFHPHSPMYLQAEEVTILFYDPCCYVRKVACAVIKLKPLAQHPLQSAAYNMGTHMTGLLLVGI